jgi:hypothetical protein
MPTEWGQWRRLCSVAAVVICSFWLAAGFDWGALLALLTALTGYLGFELFDDARCPPGDPQGHLTEELENEQAKRGGPLEKQEEEAKLRNQHLQGLRHHEGHIVGSSSTSEAADSKPIADQGRGESGVVSPENPSGYTREPPESVPWERLRDGEKRP